MHLPHSVLGDANITDWGNELCVAVNSHAALVAALQSIADSGHLESCNDTIRDRALAALALASGGQRAIDQALGDNATGAERDEWLRTHNSNTGKALAKGGEL